MVSPEAASLTKLIDLFSSPLASGLKQRHAVGLARLIERNQAGFTIADLPKVQQLIVLTKELIRDGDEELSALLQDTLGVLAKPFILLTSTDEFRLEGNITSLLRAVGELCCAQETPAQVSACAAQMLGAFLDAPTISHSAHGSSAHLSPDAQRRLRNARLLGESGTLESVVAALRQAATQSDDHALAAQSQITAIVEALLKFSSLPCNCARLAAAGIFKPITDLLLQRDLHDPLTPLFIELLWNIIEHEPQARDLACGYDIELKDDTINIKRTGRETHSRTGTPTTGSGRASGEPASVPNLSAVRAATDQGASSTSGSDPRLSARLEETDRTGEPTTADDPGWNQEAHDRMARKSSLFTADTAALAAAEENVEQTMAAALTGLTRQALREGYRRLDRELRNDILVVTTLLAQLPSFVVALRESGMLELMLAGAMGPGLQGPVSQSLSSSLSASPAAGNAEDFEMLQLASSLVVRMCEDPASLEQALEAGFLRMLLGSVDVEQQGSSTRQRWTPPQQHSVQEAALSHLHALVPRCPQEYLACDGPALLLQFVNHSKQPNLLEAALRHIQHACVSVPDLVEPFGERGIIATCLELMSDANLPEAVRQWAVLIVTALCGNHPENQRRFRKADGVVVLQLELGKLRDADTSAPSPFAIAVMDLAWSTVVPNRKNLARFLVADGMAAILDVLESCHVAVQPLVLTVIADMLQNSHSHSRFLDWRSGVDERDAVHMLVSLWQQSQEADAQPDLPLQGAAPGRTGALTSLGGSFGSRSKQAPVLNPVSGEQMLLKIHACLSLLGFSELGFTASIADQAVLHEIEMHLQFKQGRVWNEIATAFQTEGLVPTPADQERLDAAVKLNSQLLYELKEAQEELRGGLARAQRAAEVQFYKDKTIQKQREQEAKTYKKDRSHLSTKERLEAKAKKDEMLKNSFRAMDHDCAVGAAVQVTGAA
ncbi:hypothetical protein WJX72_008249 [[Myrmecia] bisecta]|uniref:Cilia- and flagella-associated protein 69 ARM repeats domain-containing protein n=1 Tax=[Myrmecia] bisecta TaxID=41462 RepID=A0AAW1R8I4_9CHLO